jgi:hypothetical protein
VEGREWAEIARESLSRGETVQVRPRGHSMRGRIEDGALVTLAPCRPEEVRPGEVVFVRVRGWLFVLHLVLDIKEDRFHIGTTAGRSDGWVDAADIFGRVVAVAEGDGG